MAYARTALLLAGTIALAAAAPAGRKAEPAIPGRCLAGEQLIFACSHAGKVASVCVRGENVAYRYGPPGTTEIEIASNGRDGRVYQSRAVGNHGGADAINLRFRNGEFSYIVTEGVISSEVDGSDKRYGVLTVMKGVKDIASFDCRVSTKRGSLEGVELPDDPDERFVAFY
jgi:hypothetical protein